MPRLILHLHPQILRFNVSECTVKQYAYRSASVSSCFLQLSYAAAKNLEAKLAEAAKAQPDNHTVYEITTAEGATFYVMFSDLRVDFALGLIDEAW